MADGISNGRRDSKFSVVEDQARFLQLQLWNTRHKVWTSSIPTEPLKVLQPGVALRVKGYEIASAHLIEETSLRGDRVQIAGELDPNRKVVRISSRFSKEEQAFTAAHELGHIVLNHEILNAHGTIHRDRPFQSADNRPRSQQEREADWFATCFLMPRKLVVAQFQQLFFTDQFVLSDDTAFALCTKPLDSVTSRCRSLRDLSLMLAAAHTYGGRPIAPMHKIFGVSRVAMAIRLEQLDLISNTWQ